MNTNPFVILLLTYSELLFHHLSESTAPLIKNSSPDPFIVIIVFDGNQTTLITVLSEINKKRYINNKLKRCQ